MQFRLHNSRECMSKFADCQVCNVTNVIAKKEIKPQKTKIYLIIGRMSQSSSVLF